MNTYSKNTSLTENMRTSKWFSGITAALTMFFFLSTFYLVPCAHAVDQAIEAEKAAKQYHPEGRTDEEKLANTLQAIKEHVAERKARVRERVETENTLWQSFLNMFGLSALATEDLDRLNSMTDQAEQLHQKALEGFDKIEQDLLDKELPDEILQRHYDTVKKYQSQYRTFRKKLRQTQAAESLQDQDSALEELDEFLDKQQFKRRQQPFDPDQMPFGTPDPEKTREPITDPEQLNELFGLKSNPGIIEMLAGTLVPPAYADSGDPPSAADLEETIDVQITPDIEALADSLNNSPVEIYNWVRNNIDFMPTYGSIQGSNMTLESKRGNAFDTASLLIALLRASGIPARYAYGTIRMPIDPVMNWVGGVEVPAAAQSILAQGGIPNLARTQGGVVTHIDLEHIWVEAWIDFEPSRGANNIQGDNWVPLDASFKQYEYTDGIDIQSQVPFDAQGFADTIMNSATIDEAAGTVQNIDQQYIQDQLTQYQQQIEDYLIEQVAPDATMGDLFGKKIIQEIVTYVLTTGLPYEKLVTSKRFSEIPSNLRHKYRLAIENEYGEEIFTQILDLPTITGSTLALSSNPATPNDERALQGYIPNDVTEIDQFPEFPGYLINLEIEFVIDNMVQNTGAKFRMGQEINMNQALYSPQFGWESTDSTIVVGEYHAIGVSGAGIAQTMVERLQAEAEDMQAILDDCRENQNCEPTRPLNKHQFLGTIMQGGVIGWFAATQSQNILIAQNQNIIYQPLPSYGKFSTSATVQYNWGIPRKISFPGVMMDIDSNKLLSESIDANAKKRIDFVHLCGLQGSLIEHQIPEDLFSTTDNPTQAISAVKALRIASDEGQRIFTLTQNNAEQLNNINPDLDTHSEILSALFSGKEVIVHENPISEFGWTGTGYIILDPETGSGAYKISGGANGGVLLLALALLFIGALLIVFGLYFLPTLAIGAPLLLYLGFKSFLFGLLAYFSIPDAPFDIASAARFILLTSGFLGIASLTVNGVVFGIVSVITNIINIWRSLFGLFYIIPRYPWEKDNFDRFIYA